MTTPNAACPCHSGLPYKKCCQPLHKGGKAPTPEALMRSRYSAYKLGLADYIMKTTHPDGPRFQADTAAWRGDIEAFSKHTDFAGLQILSAAEDKVMFRAILFADAQDISYTEISVFRQHNGHWKYFSGAHLNP